MAPEDFKRAAELLEDPDAEDCERFVSRYGRRLLALARGHADLLGALKALDESILGRAESNASGNPEWEYVSERINAARAAIAKATGEQS